MTGAITGSPTRAGTFVLTLTTTDGEAPVAVAATHLYQLSITAHHHTGHHFVMVSSINMVRGGLIRLSAGSVTSAAAGTATVAVSILAGTIPSAQTFTVIDNAGLVLVPVTITAAGVKLPTAGAGLQTTGFPVSAGSLG